MTEPDDNRKYWDELAPCYQDQTSISTHDFHFGPLLPGNADLRLLPESLDGLECLEIGCGAAQNSVYLAGCGAACTAIDVSPVQLGHAAELARDAGVEIELQALAMEDLDQLQPRVFDFVHSTFALPFATDPQTVIADAANLLKPGGHLLLTTAHPAFAGEWLELGDEGCGLFLRSYFDPPGDVRFTEDGTTFVRSRARPIGEMLDWLLAAGLVLDRLVEPQPLPVPTMSPAEITSRIPYYSDVWRHCFDQIAHIPVVVIFAAHRS